MHEYKRKRGIWGLRSLKKRAALIWAGEGGEKHLWDVWCSDHYECGKSYTGSEIASAVGMWPCLSQWNLNKWLLELMKGFPSGSVVKNQPAMQKPQETQVRSLGQGRRRRAWQPTPSVLAWRIPWTKESGGLQSTGLQRVGHDWSDLARMQNLWKEAEHLFQISL